MCIRDRYPIIRTVLMSFFDIESVTDSFDMWTFVGIENYTKLFKTPIFVLAMKNIFKIWLIGGIIVMLLSLLFGVILTCLLYTSPCIDDDINVSRNAMFTDFIKA